MSCGVWRLGEDEISQIRPFWRYFKGTQDSVWILNVCLRVLMFSYTLCWSKEWPQHFLSIFTSFLTWISCSYVINPDLLGWQSGKDTHTQKNWSWLMMCQPVVTFSRSLNTRLLFLFYCYSFLCIHICYPSTYKCVLSLYEICDSIVLKTSDTAEMEVSPQNSFKRESAHSCSIQSPLHLVSPVSLSHLLYIQDRVN